jgi:ELWxxDGT repeat protein
MKNSTLDNFRLFESNQIYFLFKEVVSKTRPKAFAALIALCYISVNSFAQVRLVADLNTGRKDPVESKAFSQHESDGGRAYFVGEASELWTSDGTTAGTKFLKAFLEIRELEVIGEVCFLSAATGDKGFELWKSDGTAAGTVRVKDIFLGTGSSTPLFLTKVNNVLYFAANNGGNGRELWKSDGTEGGTQLVKDIYPGDTGSQAANLVASGNKVFFVAKTAAPGYELWVSDGTSGGTTLVKDINPGVAGSSITDLTESNGTVYFSAQSPLRRRQLWKSDGTEAGTSIVKVINASGSASVTDLIDVDGLIFFLATDGVHGQELFRSDGTAAGTFMVKDINLSLTSLSAVNGKLFFTAYESANNSAGRSIWISDGTASGTIQATSAQQYPELNLYQVYHEINGAAYFFGTDRNTFGNYLYRMDINGTLDIVREVPWTEANIQIVTTGSLHFFLSDGYYWRTDGTSHGTYRLRTLCCGTGSRPLFMEDGGGTLYFSTDNPQAFWQTEGTPESTEMVELDFVEEMEGLNGDMFYRLGDSFGPGSTVWKLDGATGTKTEISSVATDPRYLTDANDRIYFFADTPLNGRKLWVTDGTPQGTHVINTSPAPSFSFMAALGSKAILNSNRDLWVSDGTDAGTQLLKNFLGEGPQYLAQFQGKLYFYASDGTHGLELWATDGTPAGTAMVIDIRQNDTDGQEVQDLNGVAVKDGFLYFAAVDPQGKHGIWRTDGTAINTTEVHVLEPETEYLPFLIGPAGSNIFFIRIRESGTEIWVTDGSTATKLKTLDQEYQYINAIDDNVIYIITRAGEFNTQRNEEVWRSDGTIGGTYQIQFQGRPYDLETSGDYVYLAGRADKEGSELFIIEESESTTAAAGQSVVRLDAVENEGAVSSYPSPFKSSFTLNVSGEANSTFLLQVVTMDAILVDQAELSHNVSHQIGSSSWTDGIYVMKIKSGNRIITRKIVKLSH